MMYEKATLALAVLAAVSTDSAVASRTERLQARRPNLRKLEHSTPVPEAWSAPIDDGATTTATPILVTSHADADSGAGNKDTKDSKQSKPCEATEPICFHKEVGNGITKLKTEYFCEGETISGRGGWGSKAGSCFDLCAEICGSAADCERTVDNSGVDTDEGWCIPIDTSDTVATESAITTVDADADADANAVRDDFSFDSDSADDEEAFSDPGCAQKAVCYVNDDSSKYKTEYACESDEALSYGSWVYLDDYDCSSICDDVCMGLSCVPDEDGDGTTGSCLPGETIPMESVETTAVATNCVEETICMIKDDYTKFKTVHQNLCKGGDAKDNGPWKIFDRGDCSMYCLGICGDGMDCIMEGNSGEGKCVSTAVADSAGSELAEQAIAGSKCEEVAICLKKTDSFKYKTEFICAGQSYVANGKSPWVYLGDGECTELCDGSIVCPEGTECLEELDEDTDLLTGAVVCGATSSLPESAAGTGSADEPCAERAYCLKKDDGTKYKTKYMCDDKADGNGPWTVYMEGDCCDLDVCPGSCVPQNDGEVECIEDSAAAAAVTTPFATTAGATTPYATTAGATTEFAVTAEATTESATGVGYKKGRKCCSCHCSKGWLHDKCSDDDEMSCMEHGAEFSVFHGTCQENVDAADHLTMLEMCGEADPSCQCEIKKADVDKQGADVFRCKCKCSSSSNTDSDSDRGKGAGKESQK